MHKEGADTSRPDRDATSVWSVKSVPWPTRDAISSSSQREGLTIGQWLERRVAEWEGAGSPTTISSPAPAELGKRLGMRVAEIDPEIIAIAVCNEQMTTLDEAAARRVLGYLQTRWG